MMTGLDLGFVDEYNYPIKLKYIILQAIDILPKKGLISVIMGGSTGRGEFSSIKINNNPFFLSDIEMAAIYKNMPSNGQIEISRLNHDQLSRQVSSPFFHIDCTYTNLKSLPNLPPLIKYYDLSNRGLTVFGDCYRHKIRNITVKSLNMSELNDVLFWRLWNLLLYAPSAMIFGKNTLLDETIYSYVIARQCLDLTTWLLPYEGVLQSSFREKIAVLENNYKTMVARRYFGDKFLTFMKECLDAKMFLEFHSDMIYYLRNANSFFNKALNLLCNHCLGEMKESNECSISSLHTSFGDWRLRRKIKDIYQYICFRNVNMIPIRWCFRTKIGAGLEFLISMNDAFLLLLDNKNADIELAKSRAHLRVIWPSGEGNLHAIHPSELWVEMRNEFARFMRFYFNFQHSRPDNIDQALSITSYSEVHT